MMLHISTKRTQLKSSYEWGLPVADPISDMVMQNIYWRHIHNINQKGKFRYADRSWKPKPFWVVGLSPLLSSHKSPSKESASTNNSPNRLRMTKISRSKVWTPIALPAYVIICDFASVVWWHHTRVNAARLPASAVCTLAWAGLYRFGQGQVGSTWPKTFVLASSMT